MNMIPKKELDNELDTLYEIKSKGAQIRWRVKWNDEGEKNHLENKHQSKNVKQCRIDLCKDLRYNKWSM